ncbi:MAG: complement resistance protein TraT [Pseudomonadota bacterium]
MKLTVPFVCIAVSALAGCAATQVAVEKRNLDVQTKMSDTIFLDPVSPSERVIYVDIRNTSDKPDLDVEAAVMSKIQEAGYVVTDDPDQARFVLQANVLQAGRNADTAAEEALGGGFGSTIVGGAAGGAVGYGLGQAGGNNALLTIGGVLAGAAIGAVADNYVQDVTYTIVTDLQISERQPGVVIDQDETAKLDQGSSGTVTQTSSSTTDQKRYRTRVVSTAEKVNLDWPEASPSLVDGLSRSIAGVF